MMSDFWYWLKEHDLPNSVILVISLTLWPLVLFLWNRRKRSNIYGLEVSFSAGSITINGAPHNAVAMESGHLAL